MHHRAVILPAEHAPDDGVGVPKQFAAQVHGELAGLHEIRAAFFAEPVSDVLGPAVSIAVYLLGIRRILERRGSRP